MGPMQALTRWGPPAHRPAADRTPAALATALAGIATIASSLSPNAPARERLLEGLEPESAQAVGHAIGLAGGLLCLWLALGVRGGRRPAGRAAVVVLGVLVLVHLTKGLDYEEALLALAAAWAVRRALHSRPGDRVPTLRVAALAAVMTVAAALTAVLLWDQGGEVRATVVRVLVLGAAGGVFLLLRALLAPARARDGHDRQEHRRAAALVAAHGEDSIAPFLLRADKAFHFAHGGVLAYRVLRETAVVSGDPVGPPGTTGRILASFVAHAYRRGWDVVLLGAADANLPDYSALGLRTLQVGLEAIVDPGAFALDSPAAKTVRKAVARVRRHGWTVEIVTGARLDPALTADLVAVEAAWRATQRRLLGFSMAGDRLWGAPEDATDVYAVARDPAGHVRAFQRYVRYRRGLSLDATRRTGDGPNGVCDSLVAAVLAHACEEGCAEVSLNFSGFAHLMAAESLERGSHRLRRWTLHRLHGRFQLERLAHYAEKFGPRWRARHLVYTDRTHLPLAAVRVLQAEAYIRPPARRVARDAWLPAPVPLRAGQTLEGAR